MLRAALLMLVVTAACNSETRKLPDAPQQKDAPADSPPDSAGSGNFAGMTMEVSPHDGNLELMVVALGLVIAAGPVRGARRRRDVL